MTKQSKDITIPRVYVWHVPPRSLMHRKTKRLPPHANSRQKSGDQHPRNPNKTTRDRLIEVALEDFAARGYDGTTTRQLAKHAGSSIQVIQYHFEGKEGLYRAVLAQIVEYLEDRLGPIAHRIRSERHMLSPERAIRLLTEFIAVYIRLLVNDENPRRWQHLIMRAEFERSDALLPLYKTNIQLCVEPCAILIAYLTGAPVKSKRTLVRTLTFLGQVTIFCHKSAQ